MNANIKIKSYNEMTQECAPVFYKEVEKFFAKGMLILVNNELDIIDVAMSVQNDNDEKMQQWIEDKLVIRVNDKHAMNWSKSNEALMAITTVPWVLVQEIV